MFQHYTPTVSFFKDSTLLLIGPRFESSRNTITLKAHIAVSKESWCSTPSQPVQLYQGELISQMITLFTKKQAFCTPITRFISPFTFKPYPDCISNFQGFHPDQLHFAHPSSALYHCSCSNLTPRLSDFQGFHPDQLHVAHPSSALQYITVQV